MKMKFKNITLLALLLTTIPFISFTPIYSMDEAAEAIDSIDVDADGALVDSDGDPISIDDLDPDVLDALE